MKGIVNLPAVAPIRTLEICAAPAPVRRRQPPKLRCVDAPVREAAHHGGRPRSRPHSEHRFAAAAYRQISALAATPRECAMNLCA